MKTKNILKIGIFSIILLFITISPLIKSNTSSLALANGGLKYIYGVDVFEDSADEKCKTDSKDWYEECMKTGGVWKCKTGESVVKYVCVIQKGVLEGFGKMFAGIINAEINWILWALDADTYGGFIANTGIQQVFKMVRDLTNILLILGLIGIAIFTILGYKKYAWKQTIWKLLIVALLVNFSLVIAGTIVENSNFLSEYLLSIAQEKNKSLAPLVLKSFGFEETTDNVFKPPAFIGEKKDESTGIVGTEDSEDTASYNLRFGQFFIVSFIMIIVGGFAVIALLAIFFTMMLRACLIIMLLAISPIAFAAWIFPDTEKYWKMWWEQFIKWCAFPIIFSFTLVLGIKVMSSMTMSAAGTGNVESIIQMVLFSMFLVGGLFFSIQGGGATSQTIMKQASKAGAAVGGFIGKRTKEGVKESTTYKKAGKFLTKVPLLRGVGQGMMLTGEKAKAARVKAHEKELENVSLGTLKELEKAHLPSSLDRNANEERMALTNKLASEGELGKESVEFIKMHQGDARLDTKAITKAIPHYFKLNEKGELIKTGDSIKEKVGALSRISPDKMRDKTQNSDLIKSIVKERVDEARKQGKSEQEIESAGNEAFDETIQEIFKTLSPAQSAGFVQGLSSKDLIEGKWGGAGGKIEQAINKDKQAKERFYEELLPASRNLRECGIKGDKEPTGPPTGPAGWVKKGRIWTPPEE